MEEKVNSSKKSKFLGTTIIGKGNCLSLNEKTYEITNEKGEKNISKWECVDYNHVLDNDMKHLNKPTVVSIIPIIKRTKEIIEVIIQSTAKQRLTKSTRAAEENELRFACQLKDKVCLVNINASVLSDAFKIGDAGGIESHR